MDAGGVHQAVVIPGRLPAPERTADTRRINDAIKRCRSDAGPVPGRGRHRGPQHGGAARRDRSVRRRAGLAGISFHTRFRGVARQPLDRARSSGSPNADGADRARHDETRRGVGGAHGAGARRARYADPGPTRSARTRRRGSASSSRSSRLRSYSTRASATTSTSSRTSRDDSAPSASRSGPISIRGRSGNG